MRNEGMNKLVLGFRSISLAYGGSLRPFYEATETRIAAKTSVVQKLRNMITRVSSPEGQIHSVGPAVVYFADAPQLD